MTFDFGGLRIDKLNATVTFDTTAVSTIPEPASLSVLGAGLLGLLGLRRRQRGVAQLA